MFVHRVGKVFGFGSKLLLSFLLFVKLDDFGTAILKGLDVCRSDVGDIDDVVSEIGLNRAENIALLGLENRFVKRRNHHALTEEIQVSARGSTSRVLRIFTRKFGKGLRIGFDFGQKPFGLFKRGFLTLFKVNQNVTGTALFGDFKAILVLLVKRLNLVFIRFDVFK